VRKEVETEIGQIKKKKMVRGVINGEMDVCGADKETVIWTRRAKITIADPTRVGQKRGKRRRMNT